MSSYIADVYWRTISRNDLKISVVFGENNINLTLFEGNNCWQTNITEPILRKSAEKYHVPWSDYTIRKYLIEPLDDVEVVLIDNILQINIILENHMKRIYFETPMTKVDFIENILWTADNLSSVKKQYFDNLNIFKKENEKLKEDKINLERKLNELIERKKVEEEELLSKFVVILNEKKRQIQHLNDLIIAFKHGRPSTNPPITPKKDKKSIKTKHIPHKSDSSSEESSDQSYHSDTEDQENPITPSEKTVTKPHKKKELTEFCGDLPIIQLTKRVRQKSTDSCLLLTPVDRKEEIIKKDIAPTNKIEELPVLKYNTQDLLDDI